MAPVVAVFTLTGSRQREASRRFLGRVWQRPPGWLDPWRHHMAFAARALDVFAAWSRGAGTVAAGEDAARFRDDPRGGVVIVSHHGNAEIARALLDEATRARMTVLVHTRHAENYNRLLARVNPHASMDTMQVTELGPEIAMLLKQKVEAGGRIVIAGDRTPVGGGRTIDVPFLGEDAPFAQGPFVLAALLDCPVWLLFCRRDGAKGSNEHALAIEPFAERIELPRGRREEALRGYIGRWAGRLEQEVRAAPLQWFNFFDFWERPC